MIRQLNAKRMVHTAAALVLAGAFANVPSAVASPSPAPAAVHSLTGVWVGSYQYPDRRAPVQFLMVVKQGPNGTFTGSLREPNTFGSSSVAFLGASISGTVKSTAVKYTKTYDGTGGQSHSVDYQGLVNWKARVVQGQWSLEGSKGTFKMAGRN
jgi:hypothetical protein